MNEEDALGIDAPPGIVSPSQGTTRMPMPQRVSGPTQAGVGRIWAGTVATHQMGQNHPVVEGTKIGSRELPARPQDLRPGAQPTPVRREEYTPGRGGCEPVGFGYDPRDMRSSGAIDGREPVPAFVMSNMIASNRAALPVGLGEWLQHLARLGRRPPLGVLRALQAHPQGQSALAYAHQLNQYLDAAARGGQRVVQED